MVALFANSETLIRRRMLRRLIWVCIVCQIPFKGSPDYNELSIHIQQFRLRGCIHARHHHPPRPPFYHRLNRCPIFEVTRIGSIIPKNIKCNLHSVEVRSMSAAARHLTPAAMKQNENLNVASRNKEHTQTLTKTEYGRLFMYNNVYSRLHNRPHPTPTPTPPQHRFKRFSIEKKTKI